MLPGHEVEREVARYRNRQMVELVAEPPLAVRIMPPKTLPATLESLIIDALRALRRDKLLFVLAAIGTILIIVLLGLWRTYVFPREVTELQQGVDDLRFAVSYAPSLAVGDEETFTLTLVNNGDAPLTKVKAYLVFSDTLPVATTLDGSNAADFGDLAPGERKTRSIVYRLDKSTADAIEAGLWVSSAEISPIRLDSYRFGVVWIPRLKSVVTRVLSAVALGIYTAVGMLLRAALKGVLPEVK